ncbi:hypothetical protein V8F06_014587 [Rhypophila decipiens]
MATSNLNPDQLPRRLFLVSTPRTASNLLVRVLNIQNQPEVVTNEKSGYFFFEPYTVATAKGYFFKPASQWEPDQKAEYQTLLQQAFDNLEAHGDRAQNEQGKRILWTKEHAFWFANSAAEFDANSDTAQDRPFSLTMPGYSADGTFSKHNNTLFPDKYLSTWKFSFLIRNPALAWPSMYRALQGLSEIGMMGEQQAGAMKAAQLANMTYKWTRSLYEWCSENQASGANRPLILDAHDIILDPGIVLKFCEETGLDKSVLQFEWESQPTGEFGHENRGYVKDAANLMTATLRGSKGVMKDKAPLEIDIAKEAEKWKVEFGKEAGEKLEVAVTAAMDDYEFLRERRIKMTD